MNKYIRYKTIDLFTNQIIYMYENIKTKEIITSENPDLINEFGELKMNMDKLKLNLYRRNNFNKPCIWSIEILTPESIQISYGVLGGTMTKEIINTKNALTEYKSRINSKRKIGYKELYELKDDYCEEDSINTINYLNTYLPYNHSTSDNNLLPMLAKAYDNRNNKLFNKCSLYFGQPKINGLRCLIKASINEGDIFKPIKLIFQSREGTIWNSLTNLEDYLLSIFSKEFLDLMVSENIALDGELYLPGFSINEINHFVKDSKCKENKLIQYWCYDIAIENMTYFKRHELLFNTFYKYKFKIYTKEEHLLNVNRFILLNDKHIDNEFIATQKRNYFIDLGFEGLIMRNPNDEYQFGKRNFSMIKYKNITDGKFTIIDIYPENRRNIPLLLCKNDLNDATFECHLTGDFKFQEQVLLNKEKYINKTVFIIFGERSGVNKLPFHIKTVKIL